MSADRLIRKKGLCPGDPAHRRLGRFAAARDQNSKLPLPFRASTCKSASVPRTALHRPHSISVSSGAFAKSAILIDRLPHSQQTTLKPDCPAVLCCAVFMMPTPRSAFDTRRQILRFGPRHRSESTQCVWEFLSKNERPRGTATARPKPADRRAGPVEDGRDRRSRRR